MKTQPLDYAVLWGGKMCHLSTPTVLSQPLVPLQTLMG